MSSSFKNLPRFFCLVEAMAATVNVADTVVVAVETPTDAARGVEVSFKSNYNAF
jgi:hypothetical protein